MLKKSIYLNLEIGRKHFTAAIHAALLLGIFGAITATMLIGFLVLFIGLIVSSVFIYKGLNAVFNTSFFDEGGRLYMTLPMSEKDIIAGKLIAAMIWSNAAALVQIVFFLAAALQIKGSGSGFYYLFEPYLESGMAPLSIGICASLFPLILLLHQLALYTAVCAVLLITNLKLAKKLTFLPWAIILGGVSLINVLSGLMKESFLDRDIMPWIADGILAGADILVIVFLAGFSCRILKTRYNY